jgi:hypothetical protein
MSRRCDFTDDCRDNSDEENCGKRSCTLMGVFVSAALFQITRLVMRISSAVIVIAALMPGGVVMAFLTVQMAMEL